MRAVISAALLGAASTVLAAPSLEARLATDTQRNHFLFLSFTYNNSNVIYKTAVIVQLFEWSWDAVKAECPTLAALGYKYAQVSPAAEHIKGDQWWTGYQPVSHQLISKRGNRDQFGAMVEACRQAGVGVLVDVVLNHMTAGSGTGIAGTSKWDYCLTGLGVDYRE
jgi:glycosidase